MTEDHVVHALCPYCKEDLELKDGLFPYHDFPKPCRRVCSGARKTPEQANEEYRELMLSAATDLGFRKPDPP